MNFLAQANDSGSRPLEILGTKLIGITPDNGRKLLFTVGFVVCVVILHWILKGIARLFLRSRRSEKVVFWVRQGISLFLALVTLIGVLSIWFDNPTRLATFMGLVTAGVAFALQKPISALAGYLVILRGKTFGVGDRITMGGVRGDVIANPFHADHHHGNGPAAGGAERRSGDVGSRAAVHRADGHSFQFNGF